MHRTAKNQATVRKMWAAG